MFSKYAGLLGVMLYGILAFITLWSRTQAMDHRLLSILIPSIIILAFASRIGAAQASHRLNQNLEVVLSIALVIAQEIWSNQNYICFLLCIILLCNRLLWQSSK